MEGTSLKELDSAKLRVDAGAERLAASLTGAVSNVAAGPWPLKIDWQGEIADWLPRLESFVSLADWDLGGKASLSAAVSYAPTGLDIQQATVHVRPCTPGDMDSSSTSSRPN